jgi:hypothetical protein
MMELQTGTVTHHIKTYKEKTGRGASVERTEKTPKQTSKCGSRRKLPIRPESVLEGDDMV